VTFGDSGELIAAGARLGIAHPPGYPLYTALVAAAVHAFPLGEPAFRAGLLSAVAAALATGLVARWTHAAYGAPAAIAASGAFAASAAMWSSATIVEVYALHAAFLVAFLLAADRVGSEEDTAKRRRWLLVVAAALGAGLAHHPTILVGLPAAIVLAFPGRRALRASDVGLALAVAVAIPAALYGSLLLRARHDPAAWGGIDTLPRLVDHVTAARYRIYDAGWGAILEASSWARLARVLRTGGVGVALALGVLGAVVPHRDDPADRRRRLAALALAAGGVLFLLRYGTEDPEPYALPIVLALVLLAARAIAWIPLRGLAVAAATAMVLVPVASGIRRFDRSSDRGALLYAEDVLATLPERAILFVDGDDAYPLAYVTRVLGRRGDVTIYDRNDTVFESYLGEAARAWAPGVVDVGYRMRRELEVVTVQLRSQRGRRVFFTVWPGYELPGRLRFEPVGLLEEVVVAETPPAEDAPLWSRYREREVADAARREGSIFARTVAAGYPLMRGEEALARGRVEEARHAFEAATALAGDSESVLNAIGTTWARRGDLRSAAELFERATGANPSSQRAWLNLAQARRLLGDAPAAAAADARAARVAGRRR
jgi:tetratricopeptide (TPR) repeat protein